jgi:GT2 family glycosyltransferase
MSSGGRTALPDAVAALPCRAMSVPPLSVVMPVRNALPFLDESIGSIIGQSFGDFEFVILDDASTDGSSQRLQDWAARDERIRLFHSTDPLGPVRSSHQVVEHSLAPLVARMDGDDVAHPDRLGREIQVFDAEPEASLVGTLHDVIDARSLVQRGLERWPLVRGSATPPFGHSSIMFRREAFDRVGGYRVGTEYWEDIDLYARLSTAGRIFVIPQALLSHRYSSGGTRYKADAAQLDAAYTRMSARHSGRTDTQEAPIPPAVFVQSGSPRLWAGERPRVLRRLLQARNRRWSLTYAKVLAWAVWGEASPKSLRLVLRAAAGLRERRVPAEVKRARWVEWRPR